MRKGRKRAGKKFRFWFVEETGLELEVDVLIHQIERYRTQLTLSSAVHWTAICGSNTWICIRDRDFSSVGC